MIIPTIRLLRIEENAKYGTFGTLVVGGEAFCVTLEPSDEENQSNISSIPAQQYFCSRHVSPKFGETFIVEDVPERSVILFHKGNVVSHTEGCIILGQYYDKLHGDRAVLNSGTTFHKFMNVLNGYDRFLLTIKEVY